MAKTAFPISDSSSPRVADELLASESKLCDLMRSLGKVLVAYSGGVDSTYLAAIAKQELEASSVCVLGVSESVSGIQRDQARLIAHDLKLDLLEVRTEELADSRYSANPANRCFYCKSELYSKLRSIATELGIEHILDGTNADDLNDHRPGRDAASEYGVRSPLAEVGMTKSAIRELSRRRSLKTWDQPASPCLSSRIAYGIPVTIGRLGQVEQAEEFIRSFGFREFRVRVHGDMARIEIAKNEMSKVVEGNFFASADKKLKSFGFKYVTLDLGGYKSGSMNR